jgi:hypothetical protein
MVRLWAPSSCFGPATNHHHHLQKQRGMCPMFSWISQMFDANSDRGKTFYWPFSDALVRNVFGSAEKW